MNAKAKTIQLLLRDGSLNGVINIADSAWNPGEMYASPRESVSGLVSLDKYGVYLLLSSNRVYVGQASDLERRIKQHLAGKDWWERVVLLTTQDDSFTRTDIDYLESVLIAKAEETKSLDSDNKNKGNNPKIDKFRKVTLDQYLEEAFFLMELIGVSVFSDEKKKGATRKKKPAIVISPPPAPPEVHAEQTEYFVKPSLPTGEYKAGMFVKTAMKNLESSGYVFSAEKIAEYSSIEGSKAYTVRNLPLFWLLKDGETGISTAEPAATKRYWKDVFVFGEYRFLMYSQWYDNKKNGATIEEFKKWYETL